MSPFTVGVRDRNAWGYDGSIYQKEIFKKLIKLQI
jgi:hypothetical protein